MFQRRRALTSAAIALVVLLAVAGVGAYVVFSGSISGTSSALSSSSAPETTSPGASTTTSTGCATILTLALSSSASLIPLLSSFSTMAVQFNSTSQSQSINLTESYTTAYVSATTYKINVVYAGEGQNVTTTAWILKNGTVLAVDEPLLGNLTESESQAMVVDLFAAFSTEVQASSQLSTYTASPYFHSTGTSSVTIGSNAFTVTSYAANTLPETATDPCGGGTFILTSFGLSVGEPKGASYDLVTYMQLGLSSSGGATNIASISIKVLSFTTA